MLSNVRDDDGPVFGKDHVEDGTVSRQFANGFTPVRFNPHPALICKAKQSGIRLEILGRKPGYGIVSGLRLGIENLRGKQRCQPAALLLPIVSSGLQLNL
jgi:hypothetical protein